MLKDIPEPFLAGVSRIAFLIPPRRFDPDVLEMMDRENNDDAVLRDDLRNLRIINKYFGGWSAIRRPLITLIEKIDEPRTIGILDLATGSSDHPLAILKLARKFKRHVAITAVDKNPQILKIAREQTQQIQEITLEQHDILALPYPPKRFDIVLCSLAIHHLSKEHAVTLLKTMHRLSRVGFILNDLNRNWPAAWTAWLYAHLTTRNPMTHHDSCLSVLRAFTKDELQEMARAAGIQNFVIHKQPFFRLVLIGEN